MDADVKNEFKKLNEKMDERFRKVDERFDKFADFAIKTFVTKQDFIDAKIERQAESSRMFEMLDGIMEEVRDSQRGRLLFEARFVDLDDTVAIHERHIKTLEENA